MMPSKKSEDFDPMDKIAHLPKGELPKLEWKPMTRSPMTEDVRKRIMEYRAIRSLHD